MTTTKPEVPDINALAIEACDMWQEHLSTLANDPSARAELTRFLEPQRRLFADWAAMMQQGGKNESQRAKPNTTSTTPPSSSPEAAPSRPTSSSGTTHGDDPLRVAQLALRVAELEKRLAQLESKAASTIKRTQREAS